MKESKLNDLIISPDSSILEGLKQMDRIRHKLLIVLVENKYRGLLSIGDIQRSVIKNTDLGSPISSIIRHDYIVAKPGDSIKEVKRIMLYIRSEFMPVVDDNGHIVKVYFWEDLFGEKKPESYAQFNLPIVIMAGGVGSRLKPLTNVLPKPLIPIGERTMLEEIFDSFSIHGCDNFFISVNYKAELIKYYINNLKLPYRIEFIEETKPLGTAGSLNQLKGKIDQTFFVTNCDILIDQDYSEILKYHNEQKNEITIVAALKHFPIAYGTIETGDNGHLNELIEKPELTFKINSGMYILEPHLIDKIPFNKFCNITDLIWNLKQDNRKVGVFPVSQNSWTDIGDWREYLSNIDKTNTQFNGLKK